MELFTVSMTETSAKDISKLYDCFTREFDDLHTEEEGVHFRFATRAGETNFICYGPSSDANGDSGTEEIYKKAANALAEYVLKEKESMLLRKMIAKQCRFEGTDAVEQVEEYCMRLLNGTDLEMSEYENRDRRKRTVASSFLQYFRDKHTKVHLDGFIHFRMEQYAKELREIVEYAVDEYILDQQYHEFIALLKYFVYLQETKIPVAHLMHKGGHQFELLNEHMVQIETTQTEGIVIELPDQELEMEDMIVSTLISVSPQNIYIHTRHPEEQVIQTIRQIFENRVQVCVYCSDCAPYLHTDKQHQDQCT
ncbi:hypothetical protein PAE9249_00313 [Paenibacillus sp. CECT 9249]|uniref:putative sporulation protein YtxC n=1 Tax=Paenibacillus sp. CECT 9249 TaxID=2845385 RepID=UPI001E5EE572|nr:putative sporulation protein YtxC [Paenibacillus sp. CECT 9249]CAH0117852.1 hypothetical protein PAE9249_00313 [Paenibacillus sp. CECT 9249]